MQKAEGYDKENKEKATDKKFFFEPRTDKMKELLLNTVNNDSDEQRDKA